MSGSLLELGASLFGTRRAVLGGQLLVALIQKIKSATITRSMARNEGHEVYSKFNQLQSKNTMCA